MPIRDSRTKHGVTVLSNGSVYSSTFPISTWWLKGHLQTISNLNYTGTFIPGKFRANPVTIYKRYGASASTSSPLASVYHNGATRLLTAYGDFAMLSLGGIDPVGLSSGYAAWDTAKNNASLVKAYSKMNSPDLDVGMMIGELRETIESLRHPFLSLREWIPKLIRYANAKRKRNGKLSRSTADMLSSLWLELRYGLLPIMYTISDIIEHVEEQKNALYGKMLRKRAKVTWEKAFTRDGYDTTAADCLNILCTVDVKIEYKSVTSVFYQLSRPLVFSEIYGTSLSDIPRIAWELTKLSFVWDWFIAVGNWLNSWRIDGVRTTLGSTTSQKTKISFDARLVKANWLDHRAGPIPSGISDNCTFVVEQLERKINSAVPAFPPVNLELSGLIRALDSITLIWQRLPKWRK